MSTLRQNFAVTPFASKALSTVASALVLVCLVTGAKGGSRIEYKQGDILYYAVEADRVVRLIDVQLRVTSSPWNPWAELLLEHCEPQARGHGPGVPCWPAHRRLRTRQVLASILSEIPDYRAKPSLLLAAEYVNRDIGAFHPAWLIGTSPLVVAFRQGTADPEPYADLARRGAATRPTTTPGLIEIVNRSGEGSLYDRRARHVKLVTDAELECQADTVLIFPKEMILPWGYLPATSSTQPSPQLKVLYLREPMSLRSLMRDLTEPNRLEHQAESVKNVPVRPP